MTDIKNDVYPLIWSDDVAQILDWAVSSLGLKESWRAPNEHGVIEHAELVWPGGRISINIRTPTTAHTGPSGIALRLDDRDKVAAVYDQAMASGAEIGTPLADSPVAYSFTALDPDKNQWWVNAEAGMLDELRGNE